MPIKRKQHSKKTCSGSKGSDHRRYIKWLEWLCFKNNRWIRKGSNRRTRNNNERSNLYYVCFIHVSYSWNIEYFRWLVGDLWRSDTAFVGGVGLFQKRPYWLEWNKLLIDISLLFWYRSDSTNVRMISQTNYLDNIQQCLL